MVRTLSRPRRTTRRGGHPGRDGLRGDSTWPRPGGGLAAAGNRTVCSGVLVRPCRDLAVVTTFRTIDAIWGVGLRATPAAAVRRTATAARPGNVRASARTARMGYARRPAKAEHRRRGGRHRHRGHRAAPRGRGGPVAHVRRGCLGPLSGRADLQPAGPPDAHVQSARAAVLHAVLAADGHTDLTAPAVLIGDRSAD